ncbi:band 7 protein AGAP004871-like isoform X2 [Tigriopus californicus]|uniref:band 7 protein AGAP004871-like isoform X2 n=1 Tax=Tigriopus californicus TaxID=6832 RepID=UPI0027DA6B9E|nr:band 7 protein AGAP004871-like isoform X2 [Tigriopus californicus]
MDIFNYMVDNVQEALNRIEDVTSSEFYGSRVRFLPPLANMASRGELPEGLLQSYSRQASRDRIIVPVTERVPRSRALTPSRLKPTPPPPHPTPKRVEHLSLPSRGPEFLRKESLVSYGYNEDKSGNVSVRGEDRSLNLSIPDESDSGIGICGWLLTAISWGLVIVTLPFSLCVCFKVVQEYERAVIFRLGRLLSGGSRGPGLFFVLPCIETYQKVDLRTITLDVPPQEVLTKDSVTVSVDAVVYYRVSNATVSVANVENAHHSTRLLAQTTLRNILGTKNLHEILSDRESISGSMQTVLDEATTAWGIKVERVEIKDARLPVQLQRAMAAEAEAAREARAKVIAAEGEQKASRALRDASEIISESSSALQLRYLQTLNSISAEKNSTIIFPLPIDLLTHFMRPDKGASKSD